MTRPFTKFLRDCKAFFYQIWCSWMNRRRNRAVQDFSMEVKHDYRYMAWHLVLTVRTHFCVAFIAFFMRLSLHYATMNQPSKRAQLGTSRYNVWRRCLNLSLAASIIQWVRCRRSNERSIQLLDCHLLRQFPFMKNNQLITSLYFNGKQTAHEI